MEFKDNIIILDFEKLDRNTNKYCHQCPLNEAQYELCLFRSARLDRSLNKTMKLKQGEITHVDDYYSRDKILH